MVDDKPDLTKKLMNEFAEWFIRFSPNVSVYLPADIVIDITGCAHLWGGEEKYFKTIITRLTDLGYHVRVAIADTIGAAWAVAHYGNNSCIVETKNQLTAFISLSQQALRIDPATSGRSSKLVPSTIQCVINMP